MTQPLTPTTTVTPIALGKVSGIGCDEELVCTTNHVSKLGHVVHAIGQTSQTIQPTTETNKQMVNPLTTHTAHTMKYLVDLTTYSTLRLTHSICETKRNSRKHWLIWLGLGLGIGLGFDEEEQP